MKHYPSQPQGYFHSKEHRREEGSSRQRSNDQARGRDAKSPNEIPAPGWKDVLKRTAAEINKDHLSLIASGVSFFLLLGLFPGLAALISIYGWVADPATIGGHINQLSAMLPKDAAEIINDQVKQVASSDAKAGVAAVVGVILALWAGSKAMKGLVEALNIAYGETEKRGFIKQQLIYVSLTLAAVVAGLAAILLIAGIPVIIGYLPIPEWGKNALIWARWPVLLVVAMVVIAAIYRYGPSRDKPEWKWVSWGAGAATILWLIASSLFSLYVSSFGNYNETYGSLGAVVVLMMWLYLTAFLILMGAELDTELELQTKHDTTEGYDEPMGRRGAMAADHVAGEP